MSIMYSIKSNDSSRLDKVVQTAKDFAEREINGDTVGIVFPGAIARGYFDASAEIDIAIFQDNP